MFKKTIIIQNRLGLHARPSALLVKVANKFRSDLHIKKDDMLVNGKSIMGVMMLAAEFQSEIELIAEGIDEEYMLEELENMFNEKFGED